MMKKTLFILNTLLSRANHRKMKMRIKISSTAKAKWNSLVKKVINLRPRVAILIANGKCPIERLCVRKWHERNP